MREFEEPTFESGHCDTSDKVRMEEEGAGGRIGEGRLGIDGSGARPALGLPLPFTPDDTRTQKDALCVACAIAGISLYERKEEGERAKGLLPTNVADISALWDLVCPAELIPTKEMYKKHCKKRCAPDALPCRPPARLLLAECSRSHSCPVSLAGYSPSSAATSCTAQKTWTRT